MVKKIKRGLWSAARPPIFALALTKLLREPIVESKLALNTWQFFNRESAHMWRDV